MGIFNRVKMTIQAALSPGQMQGQRSKKKKTWQTDMFGVEYNPDDLKLDDYIAMMKDSQVKAGLDLITMFLLSRNLTITPASEDPKDVEIADFVQESLDGMDYPMRKVRKDIYSALAFGYSVSEIVWKFDDKSKKIVFGKIKPIPTETLENCFKYDDNGDVETVKQDIGDGDPITIPAEKCLIYTYDEQFGNRYGRSILNPVYDNWYQKMKVLEWWNVFLQKHEGPTLAGFVDNPQYKDEMRSQLEEIHEGRTQITAGKEDRIEIIESSHRGEGFLEAIRYHDDMIFRKMVIGTLILGQSGQTSGSYAQSQTHMDTMAIFLDGIHEDIAGELQIKIKQLVDINFNAESYPEIGFESFEAKDLANLLQILDPLIKDMVISPDSEWLMQLIAEVVSQYSNIKVPIEQEEEKPEEEKVIDKEQEDALEPGDAEEPLPDEHVQLLKDLEKTFPGQTNETG